MKTKICDMLGIDFPLLAFSHCRDVVAAVSRAGGMGVLGAVTLTPEQLEEELTWIDAHVDGKPYGIDVIVPNAMEGKGQPMEPDKMIAALPEDHRHFTADLLKRHDVDPADLDELRQDYLNFGTNLQEGGATDLLNVAFSHPIKLIANALGVPPQGMIDRAKREGVPIAALVGTKDHALRQVEAQVDIIIAAGGEAGGHCGDISTMVLVPEVVQAVEAAGSDIPVLAAGGIVTGRQMAAAMAMGAAGAWTGSVWLTTSEAETAPAVKEKMLSATSRDTVRSKSRTGKFSRQLRSVWTDAWESGEGPKPLPMPLQSLITEPALNKINKLADSGHAGAKQLATYWVGQGVGLMNQPMAAGQVVQAFKEDFAGAFERLGDLLAD